MHGLHTTTLAFARSLTRYTRCDEGGERLAASSPQLAHLSGAPASVGRRRRSTEGVPQWATACNVDCGA